MFERIILNLLKSLKFIYSNKVENLIGWVFKLKKDDVEDE